MPHRARLMRSTQEEPCITELKRREGLLQRILSAVAVLLFLAARAVTAQSAISTTAAQAEAEAAAYPHSGIASAPQSFFSRPFAGTSDRRCVAADEADDLKASGSLRSGEVIVRGHWMDPAGLRAGEEHKFLWLPLHGSGEMRAPLVIRAHHLGEPADSVRLMVARIAHGGGYVYGYPSLVSFPSSGRWLVVATAGEDWGCFVLDVAKAKASTN
jgi:hypothetical protein